MQRCRAFERFGQMSAMQGVLKVFARCFGSACGYLISQFYSSGRFSIPTSLASAEFAQTFWRTVIAT